MREGIERFVADFKTDSDSMKFAFQVEITVNVDAKVR